MSDTDYQLHEPSPPATSVTDTAIKLSAKLPPLQGLTATIKTITQLLQSVRSPKLEKNAGWKSALEFIGSIPCLGDSSNFNWTILSLIIFSQTLAALLIGIEIDNYIIQQQHAEEQLAANVSFKP